jgi:hypothetical protein
MGRAVCLKCGAEKKGPFVTCPACGYAPGVDKAAMARSLMLSTRGVDEDGERYLSAEELSAAAAGLRRGVAPMLDERGVAELVAQQEVLEEGPPPSLARTLWGVTIILWPGLVVILVALLILLWPRH